MTTYYRNAEDKLYQDPTNSIILHNNLLQITEEQFNLILDTKKAPTLDTITNELYKVRDAYISRDIEYNSYIFVADNEAQNKLSNIVFFSTQRGKVDADIVGNWDCVNGEYQNITLLDLKNVGSLMVAQEQKARGILRVLRSQYGQLTDFSNVNVGTDFENSWNQ